MKKPKVIVILGQTSTGKSDLAVNVAQKLNGEIISADSRQVYRGLDIGSGKITNAEMLGVPHHLIDIIDPKKNFSVSAYKKLANQNIKEILSRGKVPILCGGTGYYIDAVTKNIILPKVKPNKKLRDELSKDTAQNLFKILQDLDPARALNIDSKNKVRLIRAIEIAKAIGAVPPIKSKEPKYEFIKIGLRLQDEALRKKIRTRLRKRIRAGMAAEIYNLYQSGVPWERFADLGFDQKYIALFLQKQINNKELLEYLFLGNWNYAKRQRTWFKRDADIKWFEVSRSINKQVMHYLEKEINFSS